MTYFSPLSAAALPALKAGGDRRRTRCSLIHRTRNYSWFTMHQQFEKRAKTKEGCLYCPLNIRCKCEHKVDVLWVVLMDVEKVFIQLVSCVNLCSITLFRWEYKEKRKMVLQCYSFHVSPQAWQYRAAFNILTWVTNWLFLDETFRKKVHCQS